MTRRIAAIAWSSEGLRVARGAWRSGRLEDVTVDVVTDLAALGSPPGPETAVAVVLPATEAGRRIVTLPFRPGRALDDLVALETRGALPVDPGPLRVVWEPLPAPDRAATRVAVVFARETTLGAVGEALGRTGASALRVDAAPLPVWALVADPRDTAVVVREPDATWLTAAARDHRPLLARPLHADPEDAAALAAAVAATLGAWGVRPARILLAGRITPPARAALADACRVACEALPPPPELGGALADDPVLAGALVAAARRTTLPLALVAPAPVPRRQRRRVARLVAAAALLAALQGVLARTELARRAEALEAGIAAVVAEVLPGAGRDAPFEKLEAVAASLPAPSRADPAIVRLHEVVSHLPAAVALDLRRLRLDPDRVEIGGHVGTFDAVETLRRGLATSPRVTEASIAEMRARIDGAGVEFRIEARWLRPGERAS